MKTKIPMLFTGFLAVALWTVTGYAGTAKEYMKDKRTMQRVAANPAMSQDLAPKHDKAFDVIEGLGAADESGRIHEGLSAGGFDVRKGIPDALAPGNASRSDTVTEFVSSFISGFFAHSDDSTGQGLKDTLSGRREERRNQMRSTDPMSHMPKEAQDGLSPRANRTGQAMDGEDDSDWTDDPNPYDTDDSGDSGSKDDTDWTDEPNPYDEDEISEVEHQIINDWVAGDDDKDEDDDWTNPYEEEKDWTDEPNPYDDDDDTVKKTNSNTTPLPDDPGPLPSWAEGIVPPGLEDPVSVKPGDMDPWINPNPEETAAHVDLSMIQMDPITPLINPDLEQQGDGAGNERVVQGPGFGHTDPSPDDSKGGTGK